jgi:hypothetical protein
MKQVMLRKWQRYFDARDRGLSVDKSANIARLDPSTCYRFERGDQTSTGLEAASILGVTTVAGNLVDQPLSKEALKALDDFAYFRMRYFGRKSTPWQERAAYELLRLHETPDREYVVMNEPPGSGKSTLFTHDIPCWLIARDRSIRIQIGSRTERQARMYVGRIKRSLERDVALRADSESLERGIAFDAEACLQDDYGAFKPEGRGDLWRAEGLVVRQLDGVGLDDKEPTVSAWGMDSGFLGGRFDFVVWDDLVDRKNTGTVESRQALADWWDMEAESRLEPRGLLLLQGQRINASDLYRYCLDKQTLDEEKKYRHIVFQAHDDERCRDIHDGPDVKPWPEGCLLDPHRLPHRFLQTIKHNNPRAFEVMYQQKDGTQAGGLIDPVWITGGPDADGYAAPGCLDRERSIGQVPAHLTSGKGWSFVTVDPSPTEWWGIIWWVYDPDTQRRYVIDIIRRRLNPEQFLSLDLDTMEFSGILTDLRATAIHEGAPIRHVVVEVNAAQRWGVGPPHHHPGSEMTGIVFVPHSTSINKQDPKFGFESIGDYFRQGFIRLPWGSPTSRLRVNDLIAEGTKYPDGETDDLLMSVWFHTLAVRDHYTPANVNGMYRYARPSFMNADRLQRGLAWAR